MGGVRGEGRGARVIGEGRWVRGEGDWRGVNGRGDGRGDGRVIFLSKDFES